MFKVAFWNVQRAAKDINAEKTNNIASYLQAIVVDHAPDIIILCESQDFAESALDNARPGGYAMQRLQPRNDQHELCFTLYYLMATVQGVKAEYRERLKPPPIVRKMKEFFAYDHEKEIEPTEDTPQIERRNINIRSLRPPLRIQVTTNAGGIWTVTALHCYSDPGSIGVQTAQINECALGTDYIQGQSINPPQIIIGDMNIDATKHRGAIQGNILAKPRMRWQSAIPGSATHNRGGTLDWAILQPKLRFEIFAYAPSGDKKENKKKRDAEDADYMPAEIFNPSDHKAIILKVV